MKGGDWMASVSRLCPDEAQKIKGVVVSNVCQSTSQATTHTSAVHFPALPRPLIPTTATRYSTKWTRRWI
ncbi:MAG: hypothetical protein Q9226_002778 [Calogaya cf. arnoldii]